MTTSVLLTSPLVWGQLLASGANPHHVSDKSDGLSALHECVARGYANIMELLLQYHANPFVENLRGERACPEDLLVDICSQLILSLFSALQLYFLLSYIPWRHRPDGSRHGNQCQQCQLCAALGELCTLLRLR